MFVVVGVLRLFHVEPTQYEHAAHEWTQLLPREAVPLDDTC